MTSIKDKKNKRSVMERISVNTKSPRYTTVAQNRTGANIVLNCFLSPIIKVKLSIEITLPILYKIANPGTFPVISNNVDTMDNNKPTRNEIPNA